MASICRPPFSFFIIQYDQSLWSLIVKQVIFQAIVSLLYIIVSYMTLVGSKFPCHIIWWLHSCTMAPICCTYSLSDRQFSVKLSIYFIPYKLCHIILTIIIVVFFHNFMFPPHGLVQPLIMITDYIWTTFLRDLNVILYSLSLTIKT